MWRHVRWVAVPAAAVALAAGGALALQHRGADGDLQPLLDDVVATGVPGVLVLVRDGPRTERWSAGLADREAGVPMRPDARFRVGSVSKTFVAVLVLQLVAEGRLSLDERVGHRLPGLPERWHSITIRELLNHTSGLPDFVRERGLAPIARDPDYFWTPRELLALAAARPRAGPPGRRFVYASTNYVVLGLLVESVTNTSLARRLRERLFEPLELRDTAFVVGARIPGPHAHGYVSPIHDGVVLARDGGLDHTTDNATWAWAAGAIVSDAGDLARFYAAVLGGRLLPERWMAAMQRTIPAGGLRYGLGLAARRTPCGTAWGHTGDLLGYIAAVLSTRDARRQAVVMVNSEPLTPDAEAAVRRLIDAAFCGRAAGSPGR
jgi:D-alanyl-D-alanine carboxypeptidase